MITILIPVYNRQKFILKTIESCFKQTYQNFKITLYNDGSTDDTIPSLKRSQYMNKINIIEGEENRGAGFARQQLLDSLDTPYGIWLDSDDTMHPNRLKENVDFLEENKSIGIVYSYICLSPSNKILEIDTNKYTKESYQSLKSNTACATGCFRKELQQYQMESLRYGSEDVLWLWQLLQNDINVSHIPKPLYNYYQHRNRISVNKLQRVEEKTKENLIIKKKITEYTQ